MVRDRNHIIEQQYVQVSKQYQVKVKVNQCQVRTVSGVSISNIKPQESKRFKFERTGESQKLTKLKMIEAKVEQVKFAKFME
mgnify:CR=1 FL=1